MFGVYAYLDYEKGKHTGVLYLKVGEEHLEPTEFFRDGRRVQIVHRTKVTVCKVSGETRNDVIKQLKEGMAQFLKDAKRAERTVDAMLAPHITKE